MAGFRQSQWFKWCPSGAEIVPDFKAAAKDENCLVASLDMTKGGQNSKLEAAKCADKNYFVCEVCSMFNVSLILKPPLHIIIS
jgi:hypothetical protein